MQSQNSPKASRQMDEPLGHCKGWTDDIRPARTADRYAFDMFCLTPHYGQMTDVADEFKAIVIDSGRANNFCPVGFVSVGGGTLLSWIAPSKGCFLHLHQRVFGWWRGSVPICFKIDDNYLEKVGCNKYSSAICFPYSMRTSFNKTSSYPGRLEKNLGVFLAYWACWWLCQPQIDKALAVFNKGVPILSDVVSVFI
jgi:hypothetical protein